MGRVISLRATTHILFLLLLRPLSVKLMINHLPKPTGGRQSRLKCIRLCSNSAYSSRCLVQRQTERLNSNPSPEVSQCTAVRAGHRSRWLKRRHTHWIKLHGDPYMTHHCACRCTRSSAPFVDLFQEAPWVPRSMKIGWGNSHNSHILVHKGM